MRYTDIESIKWARKVMRILNNELPGKKILSHKTELIVEDADKTRRKIVVVKDGFAKLDRPWEPRDPSVQGLFRAMANLDQRVEAALNRLSKNNFFGTGGIALFLVGFAIGCICAAI